MGMATSPAANPKDQYDQLTPEQRRKLKQTLTDPVLFSRRMLRAKLWAKQEEILWSVVRHRRTYVKSCHASGKTFVASCAALSFLGGHTESVVITSAPTWDQVEKLLWGEIRSRLEVSRFPFPQSLNTELYLGPKRYAYGKSTSVTKQDEGVKFQGTHAANVLIILDEAPGIDPKIHEAIEGIMSAGNVHLLAIGNPTIGSGPFFEAFSSHKRAFGNALTISAFDTPNLQGIPGDTDEDRLNSILTMDEKELDIMPVPYLISRRWVREMVETYGIDHFFVQTRVLGNFPEQSEDSLISLTWLDRAKALRIDTRASVTTERINFGIDVAGPGESETVVYGIGEQTGNVAVMEAINDADPRGKVVRVLEDNRKRLGWINVDTVGIGWGLYCHLRDMKFPVNSINVGLEPRDKSKFFNLKAELYWACRERLKSSEIGGLTDERTIGQLAGIRFKYNSKGQLVIESKEDARKRGVKSPDRAEGFMLASTRGSGLSAWMGL